MPTTDGSACIAMVTWSVVLTMLCTFLNLSKIYNFVSSNDNSRNISEGEEVLKSREILAVRCTKKTDKTRDILKSM